MEKLNDSINLKYLNNETKKIYFILEESIKTENAVRIFKKLNKLKLENFTSTKTTLQNNKNMKGVMLEFSNKESYKFKEFWYSEKIENTINKKLIELNTFMSQIMNYDKLNENLMNSLPNSISRKAPNCVPNSCCGENSSSGLPNAMEPPLEFKSPIV